MIKILFFCFPFMLFSQSYLTYEFSGGRFGDNLLAFLHGFYLAEKYELPLIYRPFPYSNQLQFHYHMPYREGEINAGYRLIEDESDLLSLQENVIYHLPYFSDFVGQQEINPHWLDIKIDWDDPMIKERIQSMVRPIFDVKTPQFKEGHISVALHIRRGKVFDGPGLMEREPLKAPPISYFLEALQYVEDYFYPTPLDIHIFTDDPNPKELAEELGLEVSYRVSGNSHDRNVIEDFFSMIEMDVLIRSESNFSYCASLLGDYILDITPTSRR